MEDKILVFTIRGDLAHFKKPYTTTSPLSFPFPPRTALAGMIAAILGLGKSEYADFFKTRDARIALGLVRPVKKTRIGHNLIHGKKAKWFSRLPRTGARTQVRVEYVKDPEYRIYFGHGDSELFGKLASLVEKRETVYTLSLGLSNLLANFECEGVFSSEKKRGQGPILMDSVVPEDAARVVFEPGKAYFSAQMPMEMDKKRIVRRFGSVVYERDAKPVQAEAETYWRIENGHNILFL